MWHVCEVTQTRAADEPELRNGLCPHTGIKDDKHVKTTHCCHLVFSGRQRSQSLKNSTETKHFWRPVLVQRCFSTADLNEWVINRLLQTLKEVFKLLEQRNNQHTQDWTPLLYKQNLSEERQYGCCLHQLCCNTT